MARAFQSAPDITTYDQVPVFRRRWFWMLSFLVFIPAGIVIGLSGPVYAKYKGEVVLFKTSHRYLTVCGFTLLMVSNLVRLVGA